MMVGTKDRLRGRLKMLVNTSARGSAHPPENLAWDSARAQSFFRGLFPLCLSMRCAPVQLLKDLDRQKLLQVHLHQNITAASSCDCDRKRLHRRVCVPSQ